MNDQTPAGLSLVIRDTGQFIRLTPRGATIGRYPDNTIVVSDPQVSRHHARISWQAGAYIIEDLGSGNGTFVNGQRISGPRLLSHGHVIRVGSTSLDVRQASLEQAKAPISQALASPLQPPSSDIPKRLTRPIVIGLLLGGFAIVCLVAAAVFWILDLRNAAPTVSIQSPAPGPVVVIGNELTLQASATGARDITRLEILVNGRLVVPETSPEPSGARSLIAEGTWTPTETGTHIVAAVAYTAGNRASETVLVEISVVESVGQTTPTPITSGTPPTAETATTPPATGTASAPPVATSTVVITATATTTPSPTDTATATPTVTEVPLPEIEYFRIAPETITLGECAALEWGEVSNANEATIQPDIGGVGTPGSQQVCPSESTTYVLTAIGTGGTVSATATITVRAALPDLLIESVAFEPNPPVRGQENQVRIIFRNGGAGAAGPFAWSWKPGVNPPFPGNVGGGLGAGDSGTVSLVWQPDSPHASLPTEARVDTGNSVVETDETNNELQVDVPVVEPSEVTVVLLSQPPLDGYVPGGGEPVTGDTIRVSWGIMGLRGFMSFDLSTIPAGASILNAELRFYQARIEGDPFGHPGSFVLDHVDFGSELDPFDYGAFSLASLELAPQNSPGVWYQIGATPLSSWIEADLQAQRTRFQARLRFSNNINPGSQEDYIDVEAGDNTLGTGNLPQLIITFAP